MPFRVGDKVIYRREAYYIVEGPIMGTQGSIYAISKVPPPIYGINERDLEVAPRDS